MIRKTLLTTLCVSLAASVAMVSTGHAQSMKKGKGGSEVQGGSSGGTKDIEKCDTSLGSLAVVEPQDYASQAINR